MRRNWLDDDDAMRGSYFAAIEELAASNAVNESPLHNLLAACRVLRCIVEEFTASEDLDIGLSLREYGVFISMESVF
jgi:hypothetical protein